MRILAGDIGGTKTELAAFEQDPDGSWRERDAQRYTSHDFDSLDQIVADFVARVGGGATAGGERAVAAAAFGIAGPIAGRSCKTTNLPWSIEADRLEQTLGAPTTLINDFAAVALGVALLRDDEQTILQDGDADSDGPICVLGAGTGLGEAVLLPGTHGPHVLASEGGHVDFAPRNLTEVRLLEFLWRRHRRVSVERVVSGLGLPVLFEFVCESGLATPVADTLHQMASGDPAAIVGQLGQAKADPACELALDLFVKMYGAEAGNLALKVIPTGGLYVAGGIAPRLLDTLRDGRFMAAMLDKGRMQALLARVRVAVVLEPRVGLIGAARRAGLAAGTRRFTRAAP